MPNILIKRLTILSRLGGCTTPYDLRTFMVNCRDKVEGWLIESLLKKLYCYLGYTSTMKQDWQSCSVKQVSAERLENFFLENLERISVDKNYIENLIFRLNNDFQTRYGAGYELTEACSKFSQFSAEKIAGTLNLFISALKNSKGIERNLLAKRFIEISLFASQNPQDFGELKSPAPQTRGGAEQSLSKNENLTFSENRKFAPYLMAPNAERNPNFF